MKTYVIVLSAALLSACAAEPGSANRSQVDGNRVRLSAAERDECQRAATRMYQVSLDAGSGPFNGSPPSGAPAAFGGHPAAVDANADARAKAIAECLRAKENEKR